jgi:hypothetical protein
MYPFQFDLIYPVVPAVWFLGGFGIERGVAVVKYELFCLVILYECFGNALSRPGVLTGEATRAVRYLTNKLS